ncbi:MAG: sigma 54-interacting transcriptional regulator [Polyangia bacterium]
MKNPEKERRIGAQAEAGRGPAFALVACARQPVCSEVTAAILQAGMKVEVSRDGEAAQAALSRHGFGLVLLDLALPGGQGLALAKRLAEAAPGCRILLLAEPLTVEAARAALRVQAVDCVGDADAAARVERLAAELIASPGRLVASALLGPHAEPWRCAGLLGRSAAMRRVLSDLEAVAPSDVSVLISGDSGTGKERCARALHELSPRREGPLLTLRCEGLSAPELARALYREGSRLAEVSEAEDAAVDRAGPTGFWHRARGGTLVLDEVGALDSAAQTELLLALNLSLPRAACGQGGRRRLPAPRLVALAHEDLQPLVRRGRFRRDLYHRLAVVRLSLPPLKARREDIPLLAAELLAERAAELGKRALCLSAEAEAVLVRYPWPGNVRELRNVLWHASLRAQEGEIQAAHFRDLLDAAGAGGRIEIELGSSLAAAEREIILQTLAALGGNKKRAAESLVIARRTLYLKLSEYESADASSSQEAAADG